MIGCSKSFGRFLLHAGLILTLLGGTVRAEEASTGRILNALTPRFRSLSLGTPAPAPAARPSRDEAFVDGLRGRPSYAVSAEEREALVKLTTGRPQIDLTIEFDRNSDVLRGKALITAGNLGKALGSERMRSQTFLIAGHTDAKGADVTNQALSERRADALKRYLVTTFGIPAMNLITAGYGKTHLKTSADPNGRENRRVQVVNMLQVQTAGR
ncbi:OmpA family protein [uncultured Methylobacterium sp.]|uniref:OmpA family protein n=1 Tax=uncultured Methylobacterium sp. TaxID=157278 RepID=UPI0035CBB40F